MLQDDISVETFTTFVEGNEVRLRGALTAALGREAGREAAAEALAYGWEHWERISIMDNPVGYLYRVGRNRGRRMRRHSRIDMPSVSVAGVPWVEPGLAGALAGLPERQRVVVWLLHSAEWSMGETAEFLGISKAAVQRHAERGMAKLRRVMGVER